MHLSTGGCITRRGQPKWLPEADNLHIELGLDGKGVRSPGARPHTSCSDDILSLLSPLTVFGNASNS